MHYYLRYLAHYSREPDKFIKTARNMSRGTLVDTYVVSWPKTGRTWLRVLLGKALADITGGPESKVLDTYALSRPAQCDTVMFTHGGRFHLFDPSHYEHVKFNKHRFGNKKVIFLTRDIRDTLVSSFFQESKRTEVFRDGIGEFVRDPQFGARKIVNFYNLWYQNQDRLRDFAPVTYEALHSNPTTELRELLKFLGVENVEDSTLERAVEYADFGNMRKLETSGAFQDSMMRPGQKNDGESLKVRRGKVGGFVDYLDADTQDYIEQVVKEFRVEGCDWYFAPDSHLTTSP
jgi:hypothetical protein